MNIVRRLTWSRYTGSTPPPDKWRETRRSSRPWWGRGWALGCSGSARTQGSSGGCPRRSPPGRPAWWRRRRRRSLSWFCSVRLMTSISQEFAFIGEFLWASLPIYKETDRISRISANFKSPILLFEESMFFPLTWVGPFKWDHKILQQPP